MAERSICEVYDDQYNPAKTKIGTSATDQPRQDLRDVRCARHPDPLGGRADLNRRGIPDVFVNTGGASFDNPRKYPMTFPYFPSYIVEAKAMAYYIDRTSRWTARSAA